MCLTEIRRGQSVHITRIEDDKIRTQMIRFGISKGSLLKCLEKIPYGPFMLKHDRQEFAIGREVARKIFVEGRA